MESKHDRVIPLEDAILLQMVGEKAAMVEKGRSISKQFEEMQAQLEQRVEELAKDQLSEFEIPVTTEVRDGKVVLIATDAMAEFKDSFARFDKFKEPVPRKKAADDTE